MIESDPASADPEQRNAKAALREHDELFRLLAEHASDLIRLHTLDGGSVYASRSVERFYGRVPAAVFDGTHPEDIETCKRWWKEVLAGGRQRLPWRICDSLGNWRWMEAAASLVRFQGRSHVLTVCRDITDQRRAEEALRESNHKLHEAERLANIGYWECDLVSDRIRWSEETGRILGLPSADRAFSQAQFREMIHPDDWHLREHAMAEAIQGCRPYDIEYRVVRPGGDVRFVQVRNEIMYDETGRPVRMFGTIQDVTERKRMEEALRESADRLHHLSRRLIDIQEEERHHLARELHDEFGQLLATISVQLHAVKGLAGDAARSRLEECVALLKSAGAQVRSMALELRPTSLETAGLEAALRWLAEQHQQRTGIPAEVVGHVNGISGDLAIACFRVTQEALTNVVRHARAQRVRIELSQSESVLELVVRDDGVGFDVAKTLEEAARRDRLGLLGMRERVQILGGSLEVESEPGRGTRIRVSLPLAEAAAEPPEPVE